MSDGTVWVQSCADADFNAATMTCAVPIWTPQAAGIPTLSIAGAQTIGTACALLWAVAWGIRRMKKMLDQS